MGSGAPSPAEIGAAETEISRLDIVRETQQHRHAELAALVSNIRQWLQTLPRSVTLEQVKPRRFKLDDRETASAAVTRLRDEIANAHMQLAAAKDAPPPKEDLQLRANTYVAKLAERGRPTISRDGDISLGSAWAYGASATRALELIAWLHPERFVQRLEEQIDAMPEPDLVLDSAERRKRVAELERTIEKLERDEEAAVALCIADGVDVLRRSNASPLAVLGVAIAKKENKAA
jgi:hypothetical protein